MFFRRPRFCNSLLSYFREDFLLNGFLLSFRCHIDFRPRSLPLENMCLRVFYLYVFLRSVCSLLRSVWSHNFRYSYSRRRSYYCRRNCYYRSFAALYHLQAFYWSEPAHQLYFLMFCCSHHKTLTESCCFLRNS